MTAHAKLVVLYKHPDDPADFDRHYFDTHVPLAKKIPGLRGLEVFKFDKNLMGGDVPYYMMVTLTFDTASDLKAGMNSPEGQAAGANVMGFAGKLITLLTSEATASDWSGILQEA